MSNSQEPLSQKKEEAPAATPGNRLRRLRREMDLSVESVAEETRISIGNIRAIEEGNYEKLPAAPFVRGLVSLYGNFLGIDGSKIAAEFLAERERTNPSAGGLRQVKTTIFSSSLTPKNLAEPSHISSATVALILLAVIALSFTGFCLYTSWNPFAFLSQQTENMQTSMQGVFNSNTQQETDVEGTVLPPHEQEGQPSVDGEITAEPAVGIGAEPRTEPAGPYTLSAFFLRDCKVISRIDDSDPVHKTFKKGEVGDWRATDALQVVFNEPEAATLTLNNTALPFPVPKGNQQPTLLLPDDLLNQ